MYWDHPDQNNCLRTQFSSAFWRCFVGNKHVAIVFAAIKTLTKVIIVTDFMEMIVPFVFKLTRMVRKGRIIEKFQAKKPI